MASLPEPGFDERGKIRVEENGLRPAEGMHRIGVRLHDHAFTVEHEA